MSAVNDFSQDGASRHNTTTRMFELRGAATGSTIEQFMHVWDVLAQAATNDSDRDRAVRRRSEWSLADEQRVPSTTAEPLRVVESAAPESDEPAFVDTAEPQAEVAAVDVEASTDWPCDVQSLTRHQIHESFGDDSVTRRAA